ncbi:hypothetical protein AB9P05_10745 [Roseivirga sp. BDSF3-8]|uniref:hypothetical protein n=1 Tax=Roseivirga sp. BDSF3-8 TaxID=3241598 RepID=UPI003531F6C8
MTEDRDYREKISQLNDLVNLARIDGRESLHEINFINWVAERLHLTQEDIDRVKNSDQPVEFTAARHESGNIERFHRMVLLMGIDKNLAQEEIRYCMDMGMRMGLNVHAVVETISKLASNPQHIVHRNEVESIFRKYSN